MSVLPTDLSMNITPAYINATIPNKVNSVPKTRLMFILFVFECLYMENDIKIMPSPK